MSGWIIAATDRLLDALCKPLHRRANCEPNFGNFLYQIDNGRVVLLDFGSTHPVPPAILSGYRNLIRAAMADDRAAIYQSD
ncbi:AarF/UbiB family protein [Thiocystis violascens]|uniref:AarF/UbiB family protein n=1 Tax=Thiocystis violascens TaxID=73141 RepID=UPI0024798683|nr:AarF/UbiB family protein [Thiocystis violascens]